MLQTIEFWAFLLSFIAIGISLYTWYKSYQIEKGRRTDEEKNRKSAVLRAHLERQKAGMGLITLENIGESEARNLEVKLDGILLQDHENILRPTEFYDIIGPHSFVQYKISVTFDNPPVNFIKLQWDDDHEEGKTYRNSLSY